MDVPPPIPRARLSAFLLVSLFFTIIAVAITAALCTNEDWVTVPWQRLGLAITGNFAATMALIFGAVVLFDRRKGWPVTIFIGLVSLGVFWYLVPQLHQPVADIVGQVNRSIEPGVREARQPIPQEKGGGVTAAKVTPLLVAWGEEMMVRPYEEHGHRDAKWDDAARRLIRATALDLADGNFGSHVGQMRVLASQAQLAGCDDPWVLFLARRLSDDDPDFADAMLKASKAVADAGYPVFPVWLARAEALRAASDERAPTASALLPDCLESLRAALAAKPLTDGDYRAWSHVFMCEPGKSLLKYYGDKACGVVDAIPGTPEWFHLSVRGQAEIDRAWLVRGEGYAETVSPEQWQEFNRHLAAARTALERACQLEPKAPEPAAALMSVELGTTGIKEMRARFDAAARARFDYMLAYGALRNGLLPRWFGSEEAVLTFGHTCLATQRFDTEVPWQMLRAVRDIAEDREDGDAYIAKEAPWNDLVKMFDGYLAHGDPARRNYYLSNKIVIAALRGMDAEVANLLKQLNYQVDPQVKEDWNLSIEWVGRMAALSEPCNDLVLDAQRIDEDQPGKALQEFLAAQKMSGLSPAATEYIANRIAEMQAVIALHNATWQPIMPPRDLAGWKTTSGQWRVITPTVLEVDTEHAGALLTREAPIGDTWEIRGEFQLASKRPGRVEAALFCGPPGDLERHGFSLRFWVRPQGYPGISLARGFNEAAISRTTDFEETVPFLIQMANHRLRVHTGERQWYADQPLPEGVTIDKGALLSLGSTGGPERTVQFRNLEWRAGAAE